MENTLDQYEDSPSPCYDPFIILFSKSFYHSCIYIISPLWDYTKQESANTTDIK